VEYDCDLIETDGGGGSALFRIGSKFNHDCNANTVWRNQATSSIHATTLSQPCRCC
jgi:hypothetical protein